jgi:hypothetical protein
MPKNAGFTMLNLAKWRVLPEKAVHVHGYVYVHAHVYVDVDGVCGRSPRRRKRASAGCGMPKHAGFRNVQAGEMVVV